MGDYTAQRFPVSVKGVIQLQGSFILLKNERDEWELPGGKLELGESVEDCVIREIKEELALDTTIFCTLNNWVYYVNGINVLIVTYGLQLRDQHQRPVYSSEHKGMELFEGNAIASLRMPEGYKESIFLFQDEWKRRWQSWSAMMTS